MLATVERFWWGFACCGVGEAVGERRGGERARVDSGGEDWYGAKFILLFALGEGVVGQVYSVTGVYECMFMCTAV